MDPKVEDQSSVSSFCTSLLIISSASFPKMHFDRVVCMSIMAGVQGLARELIHPHMSHANRRAPHSSGT